MSETKTMYHTWEEYVDRDPRDMDADLRLGSGTLDALVSDWHGRQVNVRRQIVNGRLVLTVVELAPSQGGGCGRGE